MGSVTTVVLGHPYVRYVLYLGMYLMIVRCTEEWSKDECGYCRSITKNTHKNSHEL